MGNVCRSRKAWRDQYREDQDNESDRELEEIKNSHKIKIDNLSDFYDISNKPSLFEVGLRNKYGFVLMEFLKTEP